MVKLMELLNESMESANILAAWSQAILIAAALLVAVGTWGANRAANTKERLNNERARQLELSVGKQQERAARAESKLLAEQRGSASVRWRLDWLERAVKPRGLTPKQQAALSSQLSGLGPINIVMSNDREATQYAMQFHQLFGEAGVLGELFATPSDLTMGVVVYRCRPQSLKKAPAESVGAKTLLSTPSRSSSTHPRASTDTRGKRHASRKAICCCQPIVPTTCFAGVSFCWSKCAFEA